MTFPVRNISKKPRPALMTFTEAADMLGLTLAQFRGYLSRKETNPPKPKIKSYTRSMNNSYYDPSEIRT